MTGSSAWEATSSNRCRPAAMPTSSRSFCTTGPTSKAERILANIAAAGGSGARLLMIEFVVPPGDTPHLSKMSDLNMLAMLDGKERTETEWRELLTAADFTGIEIHQTGTPLSVIQATVQ